MDTTITEPGINPTQSGPKRVCALDVWLVDFTYTQQQVAAELIPYAIGGIATYAESRLEFDRPVRLFKYPEDLAQALADDGAPNVIGFSNYIWNGTLSLTFAKRVKELSPETVVVIGGPNYPILKEDRIAYLQAHPEFDFYVIMEGELAFVSLLDALLDAGMDVEAVKARDLPSIHSIDKAGTVRLPATLARIKDLTEVPSPYLDGRLDRFFDGKLLPIIQFRRGCPFTCTFCVEGDRYFNKIYGNEITKTHAELEYIARRMTEVREKGGRFDLYIADSNFGMYKEDVAIAKFIGDLRRECGYPEYLHTATGKNQKERVLEVARLVGGALRLSGSVQTLDPDALENIKRKNIAGNDLMSLAMSAADVDANSYSELILALPGETKEAHYKTLKTVIEAGFNRVIVYQLMMLPGSELSTTETRRKFGMVMRYRVLPRCFGQYDVCGKKLVVAEIEEICVSNNTLTFQDYLECRRMHLMISIFYNDGVFSGLLKFLKRVGGSFYRWIELLRDNPAPGRLGQVFDEFVAATKSELWEDRDALAEFIQQPGVMDRYLSSEIGYNLMLTYKSLGMTLYPTEVAEMARAAALTVLEEIDQDSPENLRFLDDVLAFDARRMANIWRDRDVSVTATVTYDIGAFLEDKAEQPLSAFLFEKPVTYSFELDDAQRNIIERNLMVFGDDMAGITRILSKVYTKKLLRKPTVMEAR